MTLRKVEAYILEVVSLLGVEIGGRSCRHGSGLEDAQVVCLGI
jgi:hypothetical protein